MTFRFIDIVKLDIKKLKNIITITLIVLLHAPFKTIGQVSNAINPKQDSLYINYNEAKKGFDEKDYYKSMRLTLNTIRKNKSRNVNIDILCNYLLGEIHERTNNNEKALKHYKDALFLYNSISTFDKRSKPIIVNNYNYSENLIKVGGLFHKTGNIDSAKIYYHKLTTNINEKSNTTAKAYLNLSVIDINDAKLDSAKININKAIGIYKNNNSKTLEAAALGNLASIFLKEKDYTKAKNTYIKGLDLIEKDNSSKAVNYKRSLYYNLAWTLYLLKDYTAYNYQEKSYIIKDSLRDKEIRRIVEEIDAQNKLDIEKEKTEFAKRQKELLEAEQNKTNLYLGLLSLLVIIASGVVIYNYKLRQKNLHLKLSESNLLQQQSIEKLKSEAQIKILNATIDGKESERKLIAETLHDNVSALLSSANMHLSATKKQHNGNTPIEVEKTRAIILEASQKVRDLSHNLVSSILLKFGLEYAIKDVAKKYSNSQLNFEVSAKNVNRYNQDFEIKIFNIIQELINNIIKHSKANHAKIALKEEKNQLTILIRDDGVGFTPSSSSIKDGIGLNQIDARIHVLNGKFIISSELNKGTEAIITVPIQQQKKEFKLTSVS